MDDNEESRPYKIGYGRPPKHTQWKRGQSGNPEGRPKGAKSFRSYTQEELERRFAIVEDGESKEITIKQALVRVVIKKALQGDLKAFNEVVGLQGNDDQPDGPPRYTFTLKLEHNDDDPDQDCIDEPEERHAGSGVR
jgi:hypothetical protein